MTRIERSVEINASPQEIWPFISWERTPEWYTAFKEVKHTSKVRNAVGETVHIKGEVAGAKAEWDGETTEKVVNEKIAWRSIGGAFTGFGSYVLSPIANGTNVTFMMDYEMPYSVFGKLMDKLRFQKAFEKTINSGLQNLKVIAEKKSVML
jgi:coenzyme Q-binding protein COQ10